MFHQVSGKARQFPLQEASGFGPIRRGRGFGEGQGPVIGSHTLDGGRAPHGEELPARHVLRGVALAGKGLVEPDHLVALVARAIGSHRSAHVQREPPFRCQAHRIGKGQRFERRSGLKVGGIGIGMQDP